MPSFLRTFILAFIFLGLTGLVTTIAMAKTYHKHFHHTHHHSTTHHTSHHAQSHSNPQLRNAQTHLIHLGYATGKADGIMGPKTKTALKNFQHDHKLKITGTLTAATYSALVEADKPAPKPVASAAVTPTPTPLPAPPAPDFYATHPDFYGHVHQDYSNPLQKENPQSITSRYGKLAITKDQGQNYAVTLNDQPLLQASEQPAVIGVSKTYELPLEDALIVTTYHNDSTLCPYKHFLVTLNDQGSKTTEIQNCTHGYQASIKESSLYIVFPETDDGRAVGSTFRYENSDLEKL